MIKLITPAIENYSISKSMLPSSRCKNILRYTYNNVPMSQMLIGELEASFLGFLVSLIRAKRVLEIGCFTGYSALAIAERLPQDGQLITLEINPETAKIARQFWKQSPHGKKIKLILGSAIDSLWKIKGPFDFIFIDADKENYAKYFKKALALLSAKGMIAVDNCLWGGEVLKKHPKDPDTKAIMAFNDSIQRNRYLESVLVPIRDGVFLIKKR